MNQIPAPLAPPTTPPLTVGGGAGGPAVPVGRGPERHPAAVCAAVALAALVLVWPAFWNGYPLVFADTGTYLGQMLQVYMGWDRPPFYSAFLFATHWRATLWGPVLAQGLVVAHLLGVALRVLGRPNPWLLLPVASTLSLLTGLAWVTAQLIPDVFSGVLVLALWLLGFRARFLSARERFWLVVLAAASVAFHQSHLPLALGLALCSAALLLAARRGARSAARGAARMAGPAVVAALAMVAANLVGHGRASLSPFGSVFLAARLIYDGPGMDTLRRACPEAGWRACGALDRLGPYHNAFLWGADSPLWTEFGGPKNWAAEASAIVSATLRDAPGAVALAFAANTAEQFRLLDTGDGLEPWPGVPGPEPLIAAFFPHELGRFLAGRQQRGLLLPDAQALAPLHRTVAFAGLLALLAVPLLLRRRLSLASAALVVLVLAAGAGNAAIAGGLSGPAVRYQARLAWLFAFAPAALLLAVPGPSVRQAVERRHAA